MAAKAAARAMAQIRLPTMAILLLRTALRGDDWLAMKAAGAFMGLPRELRTRRNMPQIHSS